MEFIAYLVTGIVAGSMAGLFGVGGGIIVVPSLILTFTLMGLPEALVTHLAIGTSLACMVFTALSSTLSHNKNKGVDWRSLCVLAPALMLGSWFGVEMAVSLSGSVLQKVLGTGLILMGVNMFFGKIKPVSDLPFNPSPWILAGGGTAIGFASSIFGIGGGVMTIPFLTRLGQDMRRCIGTSAACSLAIALIGASANILLGGGVFELPEHSTGLVYWPAFFGIVIMSIPFARLGARLAQRLSAEKLKKLFACMLLAVGSKFIFLS